MPALSGRTVRLITGAASLDLFTFFVPSRTATLKANDVLYTVTDLGALNCCSDCNPVSAALSVNAHGDMAGVTLSLTDPQRQVPFVYRNGTMTMLSDTYGWAAGIIDAGQVTG